MTQNIGSPSPETATERVRDEGHGLLQTGGITPENSAFDIQRRFIVSTKEGRPRWDLLALEGVENLPAVKWKLLNISRMDPVKHRKAVHKLRDYLGV